MKGTRAPGLQETLALPAAGDSRPSLLGPLRQKGKLRQKKGPGENLCSRGLRRGLLGGGPWRRGSAGEAQEKKGGLAVFASWWAGGRRELGSNGRGWHGAFVPSFSGPRVQRGFECGCAFVRPGFRSQAMEGSLVVSGWADRGGYSHSASRCPPGCPSPLSVGSIELHPGQGEQGWGERIDPWGNSGQDGLLSGGGLHT